LDKIEKLKKWVIEGVKGDTVCGIIILPRYKMIADGRTMGYIIGVIFLNKVDEKK